MRTKEITGDMDTEIKGLSYDSRRVEEGDLFAALRGGHVDGHLFVNKALERGAAAVLRDEGTCAGAGVPCVLVDDSREALAFISNNFHGRPSESLEVVGVTGTNGKTTTSYILMSILEAAGHKAGLIGTILYRVGDTTYPAPFTTPESTEFQGLLGKMKESGCSHVVTEVSSHALAQKRADYTSFRTAVFTNLTREHLDYHHDMEEYFSAKKRLFEELLAGTAVVNADDPYGRRLASSLGSRAVTYSIESGADLRARDIKNSLGGLSFRLASEGEDLYVESPLIGIINVYNILAAAGAALSLGIPRDAVSRGVRDLGEVAGRFQKVELGQEFLCIIDFAHTDDALRRTILTAREVTPGRVITVFGCGGDRDRSKRPAMGAAATSLSDLVFITSDNPRSEDPEDIIKEIVAGAVGANYRVVTDRREAIGLAVREALPGDTVLIAGKGHEEYQEIMGRKTRFSDRETAEDAIRTMMGGRN